MAQDTNYRVGLARNAIVDLGASEPTISGGGRGWTAEATFAGKPLTAKGASKAQAVEVLLDTIMAELAQVEPDDHGAALAGVEPDEAEGEAKVKVERAKVEDAIGSLNRLFGEFEVEEETDERTPGPVWKGTTLVRIVPCVGECMGASPSSPCDCRCGGSNHAIGGAVMFGLFQKVLAQPSDGDRGRLFKATVKAAQPLRLESKPCQCGCGESTMRRFVPGHDARYHAAIKAGFESVAAYSAAKEQASAAKAAQITAPKEA